MTLLALADDATGALEIGARFREAGLEAAVSFDLDAHLDAGALVIDTETRHLPEAEARSRVLAIALRAKRAGVHHIYKKTDSTLRGPIAAEFRALLDTWPELSLVFAPAYPALGRTVRSGELRVGGQPLNQTAFAADLLNPSAESSIPILLKSLGTAILRVDHAGDLPTALPPGKVLLCDGETDADLENVAEELAGRPCLVAGTAAMAGFWARRLANTSGWAAAVRPCVSTCLVINGSLHPASHEQVAQSGIPVLPHSLSLDPAVLGAGVAAQLRLSRWAALCASLPVNSEACAVAAHVARTVAHATRLARPDCLIVFGGDTLFALMRELGVTTVEPLLEILPGVPVSRIAAPSPILLVTKAGGFGTSGYLRQIREILERA